MVENAKKKRQIATKCLTETLTEHSAERRLRHVGLVDTRRSNLACKDTVTRIKGSDNDKRSHCQNNKGIYKHAYHRNNTLIVGTVDVRTRMRVRGRTHTGVV